MYSNVPKDLLFDYYEPVEKALTLIRLESVVLENERGTETECVCREREGARERLCV